MQKKLKKPKPRIFLKSLTTRLLKAEHIGLVSVCDRKSLSSRKKVCNCVNKLWLGL